MRRIDDIEEAHLIALRENAHRIPLDCGHLATPNYFVVPNWGDMADAPGQGIGITGWPGYATENDTERRICGECAAESDRERMRAGEPLDAYISGDPPRHQVTTWPGVKLASVTGHTTSKNGFHGSTIHSWWATDSDGNKWYGRNAGPNMCIRMRRVRN